MTPTENAADKRLQKLYRITLAEQRAIDDYQRRHPLLCCLLGRTMGTDHDHITGLIRGRLEWRINKAYGLLEKAVGSKMLSRVLTALAVYHDNPPATLVLGAPRYGLIGRAQYKKKMVYGPPSGSAA